MRKSIIFAALTVVFAASSVTWAQEGLFSDVKVESPFGSSTKTDDDETPSKTTPITRKKAAAQIKDVDQLKLLLAEAGLEGSKLADRIVGLKKEVDQTSFLVLVTLSDDEKQVQIVVLLGNVRDPKSVDSDKLIELMEASRKFSPSYFSFSKERKRMELYHVLKNEDISSEILGTQIDRLARIAKQNEALWNTDAPSKVADGGTKTAPATTSPSSPAPSTTAPQTTNSQFLGRWFASKSAKEALAIQLNTNGTFALVYVNDGKKKTSTGTFTLSGESLVFNGKDGTKLAGTVKLSNDKEFQFTPSNAKSALVFQRAK